MSRVLMLFLFLTGCDTLTAVTNGCTKREVEGVVCVVCGNGHAVSCDWEERES